MNNLMDVFSDAEAIRSCLEEDLAPGSGSVVAQGKFTVEECLLSSELAFLVSARPLNASCSKELGKRDPRVLLKVIRPHFVKDRRIFGQLIDRLSVASNLGIPGVEETSILCAEPSVGGCVLISARPESGRPLSEILFAEGDIRGGFPVVMDYIKQLSHALTATHARGVVHGHLKPETLWVDDLQRVTITDFGRVSAFGHKEARYARDSAVQVIGDIRYMSPELVALGEQAIDRRSDVYSLGKLAFFLATGVHPFQHKNFILNGFNLLSAEMPPCGMFGARVPRWFDYFVYKACRPMPSARFQSVEEVLQFLERHYDFEQRGDRPMAWMAPYFGKRPLSWASALSLSSPQRIMKRGARARARLEQDLARNGGAARLAP